MQLNPIDRRIAAMLGSVWFVSLVLVDDGQAQIVPDDTLGGESSQISPTVIEGLESDRIDGGAIRGDNLFHSFLEFNVGEGRGAYFANPEGIANILSRVTGRNRSDIMGRLGVLGNANLFLLNPNGIVFGPNATLDIRGSFVASTADRFAFPDGSQFSAVDPDAPPLLTVNVPVGLQYGSQAAQGIVNEGQLLVGQDLMLSGGSVDSSGALMAPFGEVAIAGVSGDVRIQNVTAETATLVALNNLLLPESHLQTAGDLTLLAGNTVWARDSATTPFWAVAGGNLHIQGNQGIDILTLNHLDITPFQSAGTLTLVSDGIISGDAHFVSGGNFSILNLAGEPGQFVSLYDPIVSVDGDVIFGTYEGASLKVEATGSITVTGNITITQPDNIATGSVTAIGNVSTPLDLQNFTIANGAGSVGDATLESFLGLAPGSLDGLGNGDATEGSAVQVQINVPAGDSETVSFDWNFLTGEVAPTTFNDFSFVSIPGVGILQELADANIGSSMGASGFVLDNSGSVDDMTFTVGIGVVDVGDTSVDSSVQVTDFLPTVTFGGADDPDIAILNNSAAIILRAGLAFDDLANPPGSIPGGFTLPPPEGVADPTLLPGSISIGSGAVPVTLSTVEGGGGPIILDAQGDVVINGSLNTSFDPTQIGPVLNPVPIIGNSGRVEITSATGNISLVGSINSSNPTFQNTGNSGEISILAEQGSVSLTGSFIDTTVSTVNGSAGNVAIQANNGAIAISSSTIDTTTFGNGTAGNILIQGGALTIDSDTSIRATANPFLFPDNIDTELFLFDSAGNLLAANDDSNPDLDGANGSISTLDSFIQFLFPADGTYVIGVGAFDSFESGDPDAAIAGNTLQAGQIYNLHVSLDDIVNPTGSGTVDKAEPNNTLSTAQGLLAADFSLDQNDNIQDSTTTAHLTIAGEGNGTFDYYTFDATAGSTGVFDIDTDLPTATPTGGTAGDIRLIATTGAVTISESSVQNAIEGPTRTGEAAEIEIRGTSVDISGTPFVPTSINASTSGTGDAGDILVTATDNGAVQLSGNTTLQTSALEGSSGNGGDIVVNGGSATLEGVQITANNGGSGVGGTIDLNLNGAVTIGNSILSADVTDVFGDGVTGDGGNIGIRGTSVDITNSDVNATTQGTGDGGSIDIEGVNGGPVTIAASTVSTETLGTGSAGDIGITGGQLVISEGTKISAASVPAAISSSSDTELFLFDEMGLLLALNDDSDPSFDGAAGSTSFLDSFIDFTFTETGTYVIGVGAYDSFPSGDLDDAIAGNTLQSGEIYNLHVSLSSIPTLNGAGTVNNVEANNSISTAQTLAVSEFSRAQNPNIQDSTTLSHLTINGEGNGTFNYYAFNATAGSRGIFDIDTDITGERGEGAPGNITLTANAGILDITDSDVSSQAGNIPTNAVSVEPAQITIQATGNINLDGANVRADTTGTADAGSITVQVQESGTGTVTLQGATSLVNAVQSGATGEGGAIAISGNSIAILDNTEIQATNAGPGAGGEVSFVATNATSGEVQLTDSLIETAVLGGPSANSQGSSLRIAAPQSIELTNTTINATTEGLGQGGDITMSVSNRNGAIELDTSAINATTAGTGQGGTVALQTGEQGTVSLSTQSEVVTDVAEGAAGVGGNIEIETRSLSIVGSGSQFNATTAGNASATAGSITATVRNITIEGDETTGFFARSTSVADAGDININAANGEISLVGGQISTAATASGNAGNIGVNTQTLTLEGGARISAATNTGGEDGQGNITLTGLETLDIFNSRISASTVDGQAGNLTINAEQAPANSVTLSGLFSTDEPAGLFVAATGRGSAGFLSINTRNLTVQNGAQLSAESLRGNEGGDILLEGLETLEVINARISASTRNGTAGSLTVQASESVLLSGSIVTDENGQPVLDENGATQASGLFVEATNRGDAGNLEIFTGQLTIVDGAQATVSTVDGDGGDLRIDATESVILTDGGQLLAQATGEGNAGSIEISSPFVEVTDNAIISASNLSSREFLAGNIFIDGLNQLLIRDAQVLASTGTGAAGSITVNAITGDNPSVILEGTGSLRAEANGRRGVAGNIEIFADDVRLQDNTSISTNAEGNRSVAGLIFLDVADDLVVQNQGTIVSAATGDRSVAGDIEIFADDVELQDNTSISTTVTGRNSDAGFIRIEASDDLALQNQATISSEATGRNSFAGLIDIMTGNDLVLEDDAAISSAVSGRNGVAGLIDIRADDVIAQNQAFISSQANGEGADAGLIFIDVDDGLVLRNRAQVLASSESGTEGGDIFLAADRLIVRGSAGVSVSSTSGQAGDLFVDAGAIALTGGQLLATSEGGIGGDIDILTSFLFMDQGRIATNAANGGGNITIQIGTLPVDEINALTDIPLNGDGEAGLLWLRNGSTIEARAEGGNGGKIDIDIDASGGVGLIVMRNESLISAEALEDADGGNIDINIDAAVAFILALLAEGPDGSDIIARADRGNGGIIEFTVQELIGIGVRPAIPGNRTNDIDASSRFGSSGQIVFNTLGIDPSRGLEELPVALVSPPPLLAACGAEPGAIANEQQNEFIVTGRGGLPLNPDDLQTTGAISTPWVTQQFTDSADVNGPASSAPRPAPRPTEITEAQGWITAADGTVMLVAETATAEPGRSPQSSGATCSARES